VTEAVQIALIAGFSTAAPVVITQVITALLALRKSDKSTATVTGKLDEQNLTTKANAESAGVANTKAVEAADKINEAAVNIHTLVNSRLSEEIAAKEKAEALNARLIAMLESAGVKLPPDLSKNPKEGI